MGILVTGDLQLSPNPRDRYRHAWLESFVTMVANRRPEAVVILGDLTEEKDRHPGTLVNEVVNYLARLARSTQVIGVQGNHDYSADPERGFWPFLEHIPNLRWVTKPTTYQLGKSKLLLLPHTRDYQRDWVGRTSWNTVDWIFCHNTFTGAVGANGFQLRGIPIDIFPVGAKVISGDVHTPQTIGPVTYVGSPYLCDFGDDYKPRILLLEDGGKKSIPCPGPQKRLVTLSGAADLRLQKHVQRGDIVKVRAQLHIKYRDEWPQVRKEIEKWAADLGVTLDTVQPSFQLGRPQRQQQLAPRQSDEETLKRYAAARGITGPVLDAGLELIKEE